MALDQYLVIEDIPGEMISDPAGAINVLAFSWGASTSANVQKGLTGLAPGTPNFQDFNITKYVDIASPLLFKHLVEGTHIDEITFHVRKSTGKGGEEDFMIFKFNECMINSLSSGGSGGEDRLTENVSIAFAKISYTYRQQNQDGTLGTATPITWNIMTGAAA